MVEKLPTPIVSRRARIQKVAEEPTSQKAISNEIVGNAFDTKLLDQVWIATEQQYQWDCFHFSLKPTNRHCRLLINLVWNQTECWFHQFGRSHFREHGDSVAAPPPLFRTQLLLSPRAFGIQNNTTGGCSQSTYSSDRRLEAWRLQQWLLPTETTFPTRSPEVSPIRWSVPPWHPWQSPQRSPVWVCRDGLGEGNLPLRRIWARAWRQMRIWVDMPGRPTSKWGEGGKHRESRTRPPPEESRPRRRPKRLPLRHPAWVFLRRSRGLVPVVVMAMMIVETRTLFLWIGLWMNSILWTKERSTNIVLKQISLCYVIRCDTALLFLHKFFTLSSPAYKTVTPRMEFFLRTNPLVLNLHKLLPVVGWGCYDFLSPTTSFIHAVSRNPGFDCTTEQNRENSN